MGTSMMKGWDMPADVHMSQSKELCQQNVGDNTVPEWPVKLAPWLKEYSGGHRGRGVTLLPPTSEIQIPARPQVGKLVAAFHWPAVYSIEP